MTSKEYANERRMTMLAVHRQINKYRKELGDHIIPFGYQFGLDDEAVEFLDAHRPPNPHLTGEDLLREEIERLERENESLKEKIRELENNGQI